MEIKSLDDFAKENVLPVYLTDEEIKKLQNKGLGMIFSEFRRCEKNGGETVYERIFIEIGDRFYGYKRIKDKETVYTIHMGGSIDTKFEDTSIPKKENISYTQPNSTPSSQLSSETYKEQSLQLSEH